MFEGRISWITVIQHILYIGLLYLIYEIQIQLDFLVK